MGSGLKLMKAGNKEEKIKRIQDRRSGKSEEEIERIRSHRSARIKLYMQRTRRNQPVTRNRISLLLKRIEESQGRNFN
ncbi:hypothetical protein KMI_08g13910 [Encephalitozoon hellem]|nr:hypothetical protein KMI_08g13910 [Encephalitozoon hellem]